MSNAAQELAPGETVAGRYTITQKLGEGGMGAVYLATQQPLGRQVVLKVLHTTLQGTEEATVRFESEAHAVSRLNHPNIVTIYDFGSTEDGTLFIAMEYVAGTTLHAVMRHGPIQPERAQFFVACIARALAEAHAHGVVHRDLKPENIMLCETATEGTTLKVLDFGIAKMQGSEENTGRQLTEQDVIIGTPGYMAPEQIQGQDVDARADLYCLGVIWWEMLIGRPPLKAESPVHVLVKHISEPIPPPSGVNPALKGWSSDAEALLMQLLSKKPEGRPVDGGDFAQRLRSLEENEWAVQSAGIAGAAIAETPAGPAVDDFFSGELSGASASFPTLASSQDASPGAAPALGEADAAALAGAAPASPGQPPSADEDDVSFESLGGGSSAYAMMMNDIYGEEDNDAPLPGGNPFAVEEEEQEKPKTNLFVWRVEIDGVLRDQVPLAKVRELITQGKILPDAQGAPEGEALAPMHSYAPFRAAFSARQLETELSQTAREVSGPKTPARPQAMSRRAIGARRRSPVKMAGAAVLAGGVAAAAYFVVVDPAKGKDLWRKVTTATGMFAGEIAEQAKNQTPLVIEAHVKKWDLSGADVRSAVELVAEGDALLKNPTPESREKAHALFRRAVAKDPRSSLAVGAFLENLAFLPERQRELAALTPTSVLDEAAALSAHARLERARMALALGDDRARGALEVAKAARQAHPKDGAIAWMFAEALLVSGNLQAAIVEARAAKDLRPEDTQVDLTLAKIARWRQNLDVAQQALAKRRTATALDVEAAALSALLEVDFGRPDDAKTLANALAEERPQDDRLRLALARVLYSALGNRAAALALLRNAPAPEEGAPAGPRAELLAYRASLAYEAQQGARAKADLKAALEVGPNAPLALFAHARALLRDGNYDAARDVASDAAGRSKGKPYESEVLALHADALIAAAHRSKAGPLAPERVRANRLYRKAIDLDPSTTSALAGLLTSKVLVDKLRADSPELREAVLALAAPRASTAFAALAPEKSRLARHARLLRGHRITTEPGAKKVAEAFVEVVRGRNGVAVKRLRKQLRKHPEHVAAAELLAWLYLEQGKPKYARLRLSKLEPSAATPVAALLLAQAEARLGNVEAASAMLSLAMESRPPPGVMAETEAWLIEARDGPAAGLAAWKAVFDVAPGSADALAKVKGEK